MHFAVGVLSKESFPGVPWWLSGLRIQHCHCCGSDYSCGANLISSIQELLYVSGANQKQKTKKKTYTIFSLNCPARTKIFPAA